MLIFIQENDNPLALKKTLHCLHPFANHFRIVPLSTDIATHIVTYLDQYDEPFFLAFRAGDQIKATFFDMLEQWIIDLPNDFAGVMIDHEENNQFPFLWRTKAVKEVPVNQWGFIPFERYVFHKLHSCLKQNWKWQKVKLGDRLSNSRKDPVWMKRSTEWSFIQPFLSQPNHSVILPKPAIVCSNIICNDKRSASSASISLEKIDLNNSHFTDYYI
ncbi:hypothetical protein [Risungbinella massiliensis]|uniref:hypothetical protein n=1 Tax=Risungbinella massiliensis TaxID=1329796 RepID=UPI0005CC4FA9|nr:hypothetical protein [Risungbinella massiliensis]